MAQLQFSPCISQERLNPELWPQINSSRPCPAAKPGENPVNPRSLRCPAPASAGDFGPPAISSRPTPRAAANESPGYTAFLVAPIIPPAPRWPRFIPDISMRSRCCRGCSRGWHSAQPALGAAQQSREGCEGRPRGGTRRPSMLFKEGFPRGDCMLGKSRAASRSHKVEEVEEQRCREH